MTAIELAEMVVMMQQLDDTVQLRMRIAAIEACQLQIKTDNDVLMAELQADRKDREEHDNWVRMEFDKIKSGQAEIIRMLGRLLSDS